MNNSSDQSVIVKWIDCENVLNLFVREQIGIDFHDTISPMKSYLDLNKDTFYMCDLFIPK